MTPAVIALRYSVPPASIGAAAAVMLSSPRLFAGGTLPAARLAPDDTAPPGLRHAPAPLRGITLTTAPLLVYTPTTWRGCSCGNVGSLPRIGSPRSSYGRCRGRRAAVATRSNTGWRLAVTGS